ncbi:MAG: hypothetical protein FRX49_02202 [Trebouxia sp. A1-2]|nr:MAG: hypothetical protein FRX49_02202 [Trebouxia sp. A1-2]
MKGHASCRWKGSNQEGSMRKAAQGFACRDETVGEPDRLSLHGKPCKLQMEGRQAGGQHQEGSTGLCMPGRDSRWKGGKQEGSIRKAAQGFACRDETVESIKALLHAMHRGARQTVSAWTREGHASCRWKGSNQEGSMRKAAQGFACRDETVGV